MNSVNISEMSNMNLSCTAEGYPIPNVKWQFNGKDISTFAIQTSADYNMFSKTIRLSLKSVKRENNGTYSCYLNDQFKQDLNIFVLCK